MKVDFDLKLLKKKLNKLRFCFPQEEKMVWTPIVWIALKGHSTSGKMNVYLKWVM